MPSASCVAAGDILGRMHALGLTRLPDTPPFSFDFGTDDETLANLLERVSPGPGHRDRILATNRTCREAEARLARGAVYGHGDYFPHNLIFDAAGTAHVIDFEMAGLVSPSMELVLATILFSGRITGDDYSEVSLEAFLEAYRRRAAIRFEELEDGFWGAINKAWLNWIAYNLAYGDPAVAEQTIDGLLAILDQKEDILGRIRDSRNLN